MLVGVVLVKFATANQLVRLVLGYWERYVRAGAPQSDRLKGGRLLGPLERLLILSLGVGGQVAAAGAVVAAKASSGSRTELLRKTATAGRHRRA